MLNFLLKFRVLISLMLVALILITSCASSTYIESIPPGAKVYIDGMRVGETPYRHTDSKIAGSSISLQLEKEGYHPFFISISKDEVINIGPILAGLVLYFPFLWAMKYQEHRLYELRPLEPVLIDTEKEANAIGPKTEKVEEDQLKVQVSQSGDKYEELRKLKALLDDGILTQDEFEKEKQKILEKE